jgi:hypothetical protein
LRRLRRRRFADGSRPERPSLTIARAATRPGPPAKETA